MEKLLSIEEASKLLGLSPWTVRALVRTRKLGHVKLGRRVLVEPEECRKLIARSRTTAVSSTSSVEDHDAAIHEK